MKKIAILFGLLLFLSAGFSQSLKSSQVVDKVQLFKSQYESFEQANLYNKTITTTLVGSTLKDLQSVFLQKRITISINSPNSIEEISGY